MILASHIIGALGVGAVVVALAVDVYRRLHNRLPRYARLLSIGLFFELATGSLLSVLTPDASVLAFCQNILAYASFIFIALACIAYRLRSVSQQKAFPTRFVGAAWVGSALVTIPAFVAIM